MGDGICRDEGCHSPAVHCVWSVYSCWVVLHLSQRVRHPEEHEQLHLPDQHRCVCAHWWQAYWDVVPPSDDLYERQQESLHLRWTQSPRWWRQPQAVFHRVAAAAVAAVWRPDPRPTHQYQPGRVRETWADRMQSLNGHRLQTVFRQIVERVR